MCSSIHAFTQPSSNLLPSSSITLSLVCLLNEGPFIVAGPQCPAGEADPQGAPREGRVSFITLWHGMSICTRCFSKQSQPWRLSVSCGSSFLRQSNLNPSREIFQSHSSSWHLTSFLSATKVAHFSQPQGGECF